MATMVCAFVLDITVQFILCSICVFFYVALFCKLAYVCSESFYNIYSCITYSMNFEIVNSTMNID